MPSNEPLHDNTFLRFHFLFILIRSSSIHCSAPTSKGSEPENGSGPLEAGVEKSPNMLATLIGVRVMHRLGVVFVCRLDISLDCLLLYCFGVSYVGRLFVFELLNACSRFFCWRNFMVLIWFLVLYFLIIIYLFDELTGLMAFKYVIFGFRALMLISTDI